MARAARVSDDLQMSDPVTETITYTPGQGDPASTMWGGVTFHANVPKELTGHAEGTKREQLNLEIIERARENKHFMVGSAKRAKAKPAAPQTADQYRAHFAEWMKEIGLDGQPVIKSARAMIKRFADERDLRVLCEVGGSDYDLIGSLLMPRLSDLAKAEEFNADQIAEIWRQHGFNELPW